VRFWCRLRPISPCHHTASRPGWSFGLLILNPQVGPTDFSAELELDIMGGCLRHLRMPRLAQDLTNPTDVSAEGDLSFVGGAILLQEARISTRLL
jgi:hypothetical protein